MAQKLWPFGHHRADTVSPPPYQEALEIVRHERGRLAHAIMDLEREVASVAMLDAVDETISAMDRQEERED